jgi:four helix bundle protein
MAYGSAREVEYQIGLSHRLGFLSTADYETILPLATETAKVLISPALLAGGAASACNPGS